MRVWPALLAAPLLALLAITAGYALVPAACSAGLGWLLHAAFIAPLLVAMGASLLAARDIARHKDPFLPLVASWSGAFFTLVIAAAWAMTLFIPPCMS